MKLTPIRSSHEDMSVIIRIPTTKKNKQFLLTNTVTTWIAASHPSQASSSYSHHHHHHHHHIIMLITLTTWTAASQASQARSFSSGETLDTWNFYHLLIWPPKVKNLFDRPVHLKGSVSCTIQLIWFNHSDKPAIHTIYKLTKITHSRRACSSPCYFVIKHIAS